MVEIFNKKSSSRLFRHHVSSLCIFFGNGLMPGELFSLVQRLFLSGGDRNPRSTRWWDVRGAGPLRCSLSQT